MSSPSPSACSAFRVVKRDAGHWDIWTDGGRDYIIRGEAGHVTAEYHGRPEMVLVKFQTVAAAMCWITDRLMSEPNVADQGAAVIPQSTNEGE